MENKHWASLSAPLCLIIVACTIAIFLGYDPNNILKCGLISIPVMAYVVFSIYTVIFAMKTGQIGVEREMTLQGKFYFWHGVSVILTIVFSACGSFLIMFYMQLGRLLGA